MLPVKKMIASAVAGSLMLSSTAVLAAPSVAPVSSSLRVGSPVKKAEKSSKGPFGITAGGMAVIGGAVAVAVIVLTGHDKSVSP